MSLAAFADVAKVLHAARNGGEYLLPSRSAAVAWRHRAYRYRKLLQAEMPNGTPFDLLRLRLEDRPQGVAVTITPEAFGTLTVNGAPVDLSEAEGLSDDDAAMLKDLGIEL